ncbi:MAG: N-acetylneuraminate synthase family protein [Salegentibacter mishustinae]|nr:N-acetylneuraminate synthase family protein [Salegentibacter mishustinae]
MKKNNSIYHIIELANTHGGDINYLKELMGEFNDLKDGFGIKFQPLSPDTLATPDFEWYKVYEEIAFEEAQWEDIIAIASETKDVWLDIFELFGVTILKKNLRKVSGIKFQSSVLHNYEVISALKEIDLSSIRLILNVAAREPEEIQEILDNIQEELQPKEILLEFGFQAYPTSLEDSGLSKIEILKNKFQNRLVFADHIDGNTDDALWLPVVAATHGVDVVEKHVMLDKETKYDHFSSLTPVRYNEMVEKVNRYQFLRSNDFINDKEREYLEKTLMIPILSRDVQAGNLVSLSRDCSFKRTNKGGLNVKQLKKYLEEGYVLTKNKKSEDTFFKSDFKKVTIATIIACRLKSSRLPKKALLNIGDLPSVEYCIASALKFENVQHTILATSNLEQDQELKNHTYTPSVVFHKGDPEDVIQRYLDICNELKIDIIVRVTADMPYIDNEIYQILLKEHFKAGADYTTGKDAAVGTNLEIINVEALKAVKNYFPKADYSEYMTWYFQNNPEYFTLNFVDLPQELVRDYRLTLDYKEDLELFNEIDKRLENKDFTLRDVFGILDKNENLVNINKNSTLVYKTDTELIDTLNRKTKIK